MLVLLPGDLALRNAIRRAYGLDHLPSPDEALAIANAWRPHSTLATSHPFASGFDQAGSTNSWWPSWRRWMTWAVISLRYSL